MNETIDELRARVAILEAALEKIADDNNWEIDGTWAGEEDSQTEMARQALDSEWKGSHVNGYWETYWPLRKQSR